MSYIYVILTKKLVLPVLHIYMNSYICELIYMHASKAKIAYIYGPYIYEHIYVTHIYMRWTHIYIYEAHIYICDGLPHIYGIYIYMRISNF